MLSREEQILSLAKARLSSDGVSPVIGQILKERFKKSGESQIDITRENFETFKQTIQSINLALKSRKDYYKIKKDRIFFLNNFRFFHFESIKFNAGVVFNNCIFSTEESNQLIKFDAAHLPFGISLIDIQMNSAKSRIFLEGKKSRVDGRVDFINIYTSDDNPLIIKEKNNLGNTTLRIKDCIICKPVTLKAPWDYLKIEDVQFLSGLSLNQSTIQNSLTLRNVKISQEPLALKAVEISKNADLEFNAVIFEKVPQVFSTDFPEKTIIRDSTFPKAITPEDEEAWKVLKLKLANVHNDGLAINFFANELEARSKRKDLPDGETFILKIYYALNYFGRSLSRPLLNLLVFFPLLLAVFLHGGLEVVGVDNLMGWKKDLASREAGFQTIYFAYKTVLLGPFNLWLEDFLMPKYAWLKALTIFFSVLGTLLIFLLGFNIRKRYKLN
jgi:hypothetical protein